MSSTSDPVPVPVPPPLGDPGPHPEPDPRRAFGPALLVLVSIGSLQLGAAAADRLFPTVGAAGASSLRLTISAIVLCAATRPRPGTWTGPQRAAVVGLGLSLAAMNSAFYGAIDRLPLGVAITIEFLGPLGLAAALSRRLHDAAWVLLALAGVALLGLADQGASGPLDRVGVALALVAGVFWAAYIVAAARVGAVGPVPGGLAGACAIAAVLTLPYGVATAGTELVAPRSLGLGLVVAVLASVVPYTCELRALERLSKKTFSILVALEPAVGSLVGFALLHQHLGPTSLVAIALVIAAGVGATAFAARPLPPGLDLGS